MKTLNHRFISSAPKSTFTKMSIDEMKFYIERYNKNNPRKVNKNTVNRYASAQKNGEWGIGDSVCFSCEGDLMNGQHRLISAIESGTELETFVNYGVPKDNRKHMDRHSRRTTAQALGLLEKNSSTMIAMANVWLASENGWQRNYTDGELENTMNEHEEAIRVFANLKAKYFSRAGFLTACAQYFERDKTAALKFYNEVTGDGAGLESGSAELVMRTYLLCTRGGGAAQTIKDYQGTLGVIHKKMNGVVIERVRCRKSGWDNLIFKN